MTKVIYDRPKVFTDSYTTYCKMKVQYDKIDYNSGEIKFQR